MIISGVVLEGHELLQLVANSNLINLLQMKGRTGYFGNKVTNVLGERVFRNAHKESGVDHSSSSGNLNVTLMNFTEGNNGTQRLCY